jgi:hypothetical protein
MYEKAASIGDLLISVLSWELTHDAWHRVDAALDALGTAVLGGDEAATRRAATTLMLCAPRRAGTGLDDALRQPPQRRVPPQTRDVINRLLHQIGLASEPERDACRGTGESGAVGLPCDERVLNVGRDEAP